VYSEVISAMQKEAADLMAELVFGDATEPLRMPVLCRE
jgi:hypothetical protein